MKKFILALTALLVMTVSAKAMSYEQARQQALFLTDKMAYELNLTDAQYEAAYEINLDYLMGVNTVDDLYGAYWEQRNLDLSYILLSWQYRAFCDAAYFYRPLYWSGGYWHFGIYSRYPHRDYFYFGRPAFFAEYRGGHAWHMNGGRSWYNGRNIRPQMGRGAQHTGMRDGFTRGDYGQGFSGNPNNMTSFGTARRQPQMNNNSRNGNFINRNSGNSSFGNGQRNNAPSRNGSTFGNRESSTRSTVTRPNNSQNSTFGTGRGNSTPRNTFSPNRNNSSSNGSFINRNSSSNDTQRGRVSGSMPSRSNSVGSSRLGSSGINRSSSSAPSRNSSSFGNGGRSGSGLSMGSSSRPSISHSQSAPSRSSGSMSGGSSRGGNSGSHGGGSFGSRR